MGFFFAENKTVAIHPWYPEVIVYHVVSSWTLVASLALLTIFRAASAIQSYGKGLIGPSDMFDGLWPYKEDRPTIGTLFFGRTFWKEHLKYVSMHFDNFFNYLICLPVGNQKS